MNAKNRELLYKQNVANTKNKNILNIIIVMTKLEILEYELNESLVILFNKINKILDNKETLSLFEYIDSVFIDLSFLSECGLLLKYQVYSYIIRYYLSKFFTILKSLKKK